MRKLLKWTGYTVAGLVVLLVVVAAALYVVGGRKVSRTYEVQTAGLTIPSDSAAVARGAYVMATNGCNDCHGENLAGSVMIDAPPFRVVASNLTAGRGGIGGQYSDEDWDRSIRHGVRPDGRPVYIMPSAAFHNLSDADTAALIAYLKTVEPVDNELPATALRPLGRLLAAFAIDPEFEVRTTAARRDAPEAGPTAAYGEYLASVTCTYCHGADLRGAQPPNPDSPRAPDIVVTGQWPLETFKQVLRTGRRPDGSTIDTDFMPIAFTRNLTDSDLEALHAHLASLSGGAVAAAR